MPHEDADAATRHRAGVPRPGHDDPRPLARRRRCARPATGCWSTLADGRTVDRLARADGGGLGARTPTGSGLAEYGVKVGRGGYVTVDRVSRTNVPGIYAAGDCTGVLPLASVAAMQGRIAMWHALGEAVAPLQLRTVSANVFTDPELATVGVSQTDVDSGQGAGPRR